MAGGAPAGDSTAAGPAPSPGGEQANALYLVATWVSRRTTIEVGTLGAVTFARGWYVYVGSARRGRDARVARHLRPKKTVRWHADYLLGVYPGRAAWLVDGVLTECELAGALARLPGATRHPPRFGAGDCRCPGHLVRLLNRPTSASVRAALCAAQVTPVPFARLATHVTP